MSNLILRSIGIDIHKDSYSLSAFDLERANFSAACTIAADSKGVIKYIQRLSKDIGAPVSIEVGYEAGPIGFGLKMDLEKTGIKCHVMAPTSIYRPAGGVRVKTDVRDVRALAKAVYWVSYSEVAPLSEEDEAYRDYIRMRDDRKEDLKKAKQHLLSFLLRRGRKYTGGKPWTHKHIAWLNKVEFGNSVDKMTFKSTSTQLQD